MDYSITLSEFSVLSEEKRKVVSDNMKKVASSEYLHGRWSLLKNYKDWKYEVFENLKEGKVEDFTNEIDMTNEL